MINRTFQDIPEGKIGEADQRSFLESLGWRGSTWDGLLRSRGVLIISEAGAGKTYECRTRKTGLWDAGEPAFFVDLSALADDDLLSQLDPEEEARFDAWLVSQSDVATFFLDSIDELTLTSRSFEIALKRLKKCIGNRLHRVRIVITTRPIPFDEHLVRSVLPVPPAPSAQSNEETFAKIAMGEHRDQRDDGSNDQTPEWRSVALMPLSDEQIIQFASDEGVNDPDILMEHLQRRNALEFARRPQDLIELCSDWLEHNRIRTHRDQVAANVRVKLRPGNDRDEPAELSVDKATEGASRLALAVQMTRRLTIRHSVACDPTDEEAALDPAKILTDWQPNEIKALLQRPLFGFASYGRVRFHHRSVAEYLAAERLLARRKKGMPFHALKRLLFSETNGKTIVLPSKRPVAGWLALQEDRVYELLRDNEPAVLLNEGDPESLTPSQRSQALRSYADRYGTGGWRDLRVPQIQVHRFASKELADDINKIWREGVENPEVREVLIGLVEAGRMEACADIVFGVSQGATAPAAERMAALDALVALDDPRPGEIAESIADADVRWCDSVARGAVLRLFPNHMCVEQLCRALRWIAPEKRSVGDLNWQLPRLISESCLEHSILEKLHGGLLELVSEGLKWQREWPHIASDRPHLSEALAATCERGLDISQDDKWLHAAVIALRLHHLDHGDDEPIMSLRQRLRNLNAKANERLFRVADALFQSIHKEQDPWNRLARVKTPDGPLRLKPDRDMNWVMEALGDTTRDVGERAMLLEAAICLSPDREKRVEHVEQLRPLVADEPSFVQRLEAFVRPSRPDNVHHRWEKQQAERRQQEQRRKAEDRARWVRFWREVANQPETAFSPENGLNTAYVLWHAMRHDGDNSRSSGWNRRFVEEHFDQETADRLRGVLMDVWRGDHPTFPSERPEGERNEVLVRWQLGLAAIYAEAEDREWANKLSDTEAELAARYAPLELNGLPQWIEALVDAHPGAVDRALGRELSWELARPPGAHGGSSLLQSIGYSSQNVARLFLPQLGSWLEASGDRIDSADDARAMTERVRQVTRAILEHGDAAQIERLRERALQRPEQELPLALRVVWLSALMRVDPQAGVERLASEIEAVEPAERSEAVTWLAGLFGDRQDAIVLNDERFTPPLLLRLVRLGLSPRSNTTQCAPRGIALAGHAILCRRSTQQHCNGIVEREGQGGLRRQA